MKKGNKRSKKTGDRPRARAKAGTEENTPLLGEEAGVQFPHGEKNKRLSGAKAGMEENTPLLGFACSDCLEFQSDLAKSALEYYKIRKDNPAVFEDVQVFSACFLNSWPRKPSAKYRSTDKCHISFYAKPETSGSDDASVKWFFAELIDANDGDFRTAFCEMMDPSHPDITYGCGICPFEKYFPHPPKPYGERFRERPPSKLSCENKASGFRHYHRTVRARRESKRGKIKNKEVKKGLTGHEAAEIALAWGKKDGMYQVDKVEYLEKMPFFWIETEGTNVWYHVGFTASSSDGSPKRLFGELRFDEGAGKFVATCCSVLETSDSGIRRGCGFCPPSEQYLHPAGGYRCGDWADRPPPLEFTEPSSYEWAGGMSCGSDSDSGSVDFSANWGGEVSTVRDNDWDNLFV